MFDDIYKLKKGRTKRISSYDTSGRNADRWTLLPGETRVVADIKGPGKITHIWMTSNQHYREVLLKFTWDNADQPSIICPMGDFFCLGHGIVNSFQSLLFTASTANNNRMNAGCALNCYVPMPFKERALIELVNESQEPHMQYFYVDYETYEDPNILDGMGYFHAEFHRENPFGGWGDEIAINSPESDIINKEHLAWENNYVILETKGRGHYLGCNYSITNLHGGWWGEGDDMIWVDGYKWPPDLHGTGSEDYFNQAWGMQPNAFLRNGSSIYEYNTGGYQTCYIFHIENPVRFEKEIKVTIEHGHGNHLRNEVCSVAYWFAEKPTPIKPPPPLEKRMPIRKVNGKWILDPQNQITSHEVKFNAEMLKMKRKWKGKHFEHYVNVKGILVRHADEQIFLKAQFSPQNPVLYDVPLAEFLEPFNNHPVRVKIAASPEALETAPPLFGNLTVGEKSFVLQEGTKIQDLNALLTTYFGKRVTLEVLQVFPEDQDPFHKEEYEINLCAIFQE